MHPQSDSSQPLAFPVLLGDIGGTNARFAILRDDASEPEIFPVLPTGDFAEIDEAIAAALENTDLKPCSAVLALAGPIDGEEVDLTNADWVVRPARLIADLGLETVVLVNDFEAQALAVSALPGTALEKIGGGKAQENGSRAVLGPGTGLGVAGLVRARDIWIPVAGEGGHVDLGPRDEGDAALWPHLERIEGRVSAEQVLSGRGLLNLYRALCASKGETPRHDDPADVTKAALETDDALAGETIRLFARYLARVAGDLALLFMARGGVYVGGGIVPRILPILDRGEIRRVFEDKAPHGDLLREIPLYVITEELPALAGLAAYAKAPERFGLETDGRRWEA